jgi:hypothetical protein
LELLPARIDPLALQIVQLRKEVHGGFSAIRQEMREGDEETRRLMRVLMALAVALVACLGGLVLL